MTGPYPPDPFRGERRPLPGPRPVPLARPGPHPLVGVLAVVIVLLVAALAVGGLALADRPTTIDGHGSVAGRTDTAPGPGTKAPSLPPGAAKTSGVASPIQQLGIVTILSTLEYQNAKSAGTGMVIDPDGSVLTNNHVIRGATSIAVTVETTGRTYRADVVGTAPDNDIALLKLRKASGLRTARLAGDARDIRIGDKIIGIGNARGTGTLRAAGGKVTALNRSITASDETGQTAERLTGLIEINARIVSGDSGGPLYDDRGRVVGVNTAASRQSSKPTAYAIPIENAVNIADRIAAGNETTSIHIGYPGFLGVSTRNAPAGRGASVVALLDRGPAAGAGVKTGSIITKIDDTVIRSADKLRQKLTLVDPGTKVRVTWTTPSGNERTATMTLGTGPAD